MIGCHNRMPPIAAPESGKLIIRALAEVFNEQNFQLETMMITLSEVKMSADLRVAHIYFRYITIGSAREVTLEEATLFLQNQAGLIRRRHCLPCLSKILTRIALSP